MRELICNGRRYENYNINEFGEVYSKRRGIYLKPHRNNVTGDYMVNVHDNGVKYSIIIHRAVYESYNDVPSDSKVFVYHIDGG